MALRAGRVGVRPDQLDSQGRVKKQSTKKGGEKNVIKSGKSGSKSRSSR